MFVGVEQGLFKKHGIDVHLKVVNAGTDMVNAMQKREVQIGDMSVTTFLTAPCRRSLCGDRHHHE